MSFWDSMVGMVQAELASADPSESLRRINEQGITLLQTNMLDPLTVRFTVHRTDYRKLKKLAEKRGEKLKLCARSGLYWWAKRMRKHPLLLFGAALLLASSIWLPTRVLFIQVEGNSAIPARQILEAAQQCGICFGASRREIRSEKMKNALLSAIPELQWAGINTTGCTAVISVREKTVSETQPEVHGVSHIVAIRDGVIRSCTVTSGAAVCKPGDAVEKGQILVSGYTDCGLMIRATRAEAEIIGSTVRELTAVSPAVYAVRSEETKKEVHYSLRIGKKQINFFQNSGISDTTCGKMVSIRPLTLPGGFTLPVSLVTETITKAEDSQQQIPEEEVGADLQEFSREYLLSHMLAGKIVDSETHLQADGMICAIYGIYDCEELLGQERMGEILTDDGETNRADR